MNKRLYFIASVVGVAIFGILLIQCNWIVNIIRSEKVSFNYQVTGAMLEVVRFFENEELSTEFKLYYKNDDLYQKPVRKSQLDEYDRSHEQLTLQPNFFTEKTNLTSDFFRHLYNKNKTKLIEERIDSTLLDSLIKVNLIKRHIKGEYEYAVYHPVRDTLLYKYIKSDSRENFFNNASSFMLFPSDRMKNSAFLLIYFPHDTSIIVHHILPLVLATFFLIIFLVTMYVITLRFAVEQKKLKEVENDFINNMTHEFKTPISTIGLASEALSDPIIRNNENLVAQYIKTIAEENKRLEKMAENILITAKINNGKYHLQKESFDLHEVIKDIVEKQKMQVEIKDGKIELLLEAANSEIFADKMHVTNLISNLIDNANKYSLKKPLINISTKSSNKNIIICVKDNGIGIDKLDQKKIFDKLYRVPTGNVHDFKGFGLGLSYVKAIVEAHEGYIEVNSELGKGSTFCIYLPLKENK